KQKLFRNLEDVVTTAKREGLFVCIGGEDASRANSDFLIELMHLSQEIGADRFRYCDTVGILTPYQTYKNISKLTALNILDIEMHTHNDFGMATANSIAGVEAVAIGANTTFIGLGERAGNASFEQFLMSLTHQFGEQREINPQKLKSLVEMVAKASNREITTNQPIIGEHIFSHESGIHVSGMIRSKSAYEPFLPEEVGLRRYFPIGKHSGSATILHHLKGMGIFPTQERVKAILPKVRDIVTNRKSVISTEELRELYLCS
ncbi:MAG TPA: homocitrate synthase, partial [Campylobacterales bacterium]|nr:homocitrate synthase [Campylobacterales bacterium]